MEAPSPQTPAQCWWIAIRTPFYFLLLSTVTIGTLALVGAFQIQGINRSDAGIRVDRAGRAAAALVHHSLDGAEVITNDEGQAESIVLDTALIAPDPAWEALLDEIAEVNQGAANVFRYNIETASFDRVATTFTTPEGDRVGGSAPEPGLIAEGHPAYESIISVEPYIGEVPVADRKRLAYLTPLTDFDGQMTGILAVDVGWSDDLLRLNSDVSYTAIIVTLLIVALITIAGFIQIFWSFRPLQRLTEVAHELGRNEEPSEQMLELADRDDEVGYLAKGLTQVAELRRTLQQQAHCDLLTGVANRAGLMAELERRFHGLTTDQSDAGPFALLIVDLDGFKQVNDGLGHQAGDEILCIVADELQALLEPGEFLARFGGDEFAVLSRIDSGVADSVDELAARVCSRVSGSFKTSAGEAHVGASIGIALAPFDGDNAKAVMANADMALYEVKRNQRGTIRRFEPAMAQAVERQVYLVPELRRAIDSDLLTLAYQPVYSASGSMIGVEGLTRWTHETQGVIPPSEFIPIAESAGLIEDLGMWVLEQACRQITTWTRQYDNVPTVSINISMIQLRLPHFVESIARLLEQFPLAKGHLSLELTESITLEAESGWHRPVLAQLSKLGILVAIDDFGTGYSSLSYLRDLAVDQVKIDRSFITAAALDHDHALLLGGMVALGKGLGLKVVLEGIENPAELIPLEGMAFDGLQGYLFGRPMSAENIASRFGALHPVLAVQQVSHV